MVLALIGLTAMFLVGDAGVFFRAAKKDEPPHRILRKAVLTATYKASQAKEVIYLRYDDENGTLNIENAAGNRLEFFRMEKLEKEEIFGSSDDEFSLLFEAELPLAGIDGDEGDWSEEEMALPRVAFHPTGVSTPFQARLRTGPGDDKESLIRFDPFSGYSRSKLEEEVE